MKKFLFFSSALVMTMTGAFGADKIITSENTCTVDVLGVSDNNAVANTIATWGLIDYECPAGQYLLETETSVECTPCPTGSYCPGGTYTVESENKGTNICPSGYPNSDTGASADTQCYTACSVDMVAHATAVSGNDYFGSGVDTCDATACETGYHVGGGRLEFYEKTPLIPVDHSDFYYLGARVNAFGEFYSDSFSEAELTENNTWANKMGDDIVYGRASCQPQRHNEGLQQILEEYSAQVVNGTMTLEEYQSAVASVTDPGTAKFMAEALEAYLVASSGDVTNEKLYEILTALEEYSAKVYIRFEKVFDVDYNTNSSGKYCYCQLTDFVPAGGSKQPIVSAPWVKISGFESSENCASGCAEVCSGVSQADIVGFGGYTAALFDATDYRMTGGMCKITENNCPAGQYLAIVGDAMMCVPCKSGSYCPGGVYTIESENKGTNICPSGYPNSDAGASADTQCYTACSVDMVAHATAVSGNDYFGTGVDTCGATACATGYHVDGGGIELVEKTPLAPISLTDAGDGSRYVRADGTSGSSGTVDAIPADSVTTPNTWATAYSDGVLYGKASCQPKIDPTMEYISNNSSALMGGQMSLEDFLTGLEPLAGPVKTEYVKNTFIGYATGAISEEEVQKRAFGVFQMEPNANYSTDSTGQYCYCQMDGFMPTGGTKAMVTSAPWVFLRGDYGSAVYCATDCANFCASGLRYDDVSSLAFRAAMVGSLSAVETGKTCAANVLNIVWDPANDGAVIENQCTYNESITVPADPVKPGFTFAGWKLLEENK